MTTRRCVGGGGQLCLLGDPRAARHAACSCVLLECSQPCSMLAAPPHLLHRSGSCTGCATPRFCRLSSWPGACSSGQSRAARVAAMPHGPPHKARAAGGGKAADAGGPPSRLPPLLTAGSPSTACCASSLNHLVLHLPTGSPSTALCVSSPWHGWRCRRRGWVGGRGARGGRCAAARGAAYPLLLAEAL